MKKRSAVMVTGGAGFIGSAIVRELVKDNYTVICYDNFLHGNRANIDGLGDSLTIVNGDVLDSWKLLDTINDFDVKTIINCIGDSFVPTAYEIPERFFDINLRGTLSVLMAAKRLKIERLVHISSAEVYGESKTSKTSEEAKLDPLNTYAVSKLAADRLCYTFFLEHKIPIVITRLFASYGPRETHPYIIPEIISQLSKTNELKLGNIHSERDFTYVNDTARAIVQALEAEIPYGEAVNIGSGTSYKIEWLANVISEIMGVKNLIILYDPSRSRCLDIESFKCDNSKLQKYTNWKPIVNIREGLRLTVEYYRSTNCKWSWEQDSKDVLYKV